jgi:hypothetical protein
MTEAEWLDCTDPKQMVGLLKRRASDRQVRLLLCACARALWGKLLDERSREAVEVGERFADEPGDEDMLGPAYREAAAAQRELGHRTLRADAAQISLESVDRWVGVASAVGFADQVIPPLSVAQLLREVFNPFSPVAVEPDWLAWHGGAAVKLAAAVYEERELPSGHLDAVRLAILADMLEEAGCSAPRLLGHLRSPGPHVRGCWAVDAVVGRE